MSSEFIEWRVFSALEDAKRSTLTSIEALIGSVSVCYVRLNAAVRQVRTQYPDTGKHFIDAIDDLKSEMTGLERIILNQKETVHAVGATYKNAISRCTTEVDSFISELEDKAAKLQKEIHNAVCERGSALSRMKSVESDLASMRSQIDDLTKRTAINPEVRARVFAMHNGKCHYCDHDIAMTREEIAGGKVEFRLFHLDHMVPRSFGGPDHEVNFLPACEPCNVAKGNKHYWEFIKERHPHLRLVASR